MAAPATVRPGMSNRSIAGEQSGGSGEQRERQHFAAQPDRAQTFERAIRVDRPAQVQRRCAQTDAGEHQRCELRKARGRRPTRKESSSAQRGERAHGTAASAPA